MTVRLVSVREAARLAGVPVRTVWSWIAADRMTTVLPPGRRRGALVDPREVQELAGLRRAGRLPRIDPATRLH